MRIFQVVIIKVVFPKILIIINVHWICNYLLYPSTKHVITLFSVSLDLLSHLYHYVLYICLLVLLIFFLFLLDINVHIINFKYLLLVHINVLLHSSSHESESESVSFSLSISYLTCIHHDLKFYYIIFNTILSIRYHSSSKK